jgi:hypothetical protein
LQNIFKEFALICEIVVKSIQIFLAAVVAIQGRGRIADWIGGLARDKIIIDTDYMRKIY